MSYTNGTAALQFPSSYVLMSEEEMEYVEGGYTFRCEESATRLIKISRDTFAKGVNVATYIAATIAGASAISALKTSIKKYGLKVLGQKFATIIAKVGIPIAFANGIMERVSDNWTVGYAVAWVADCCDCKGRSGYVEYYSYTR